MKICDLLDQNAITIHNTDHGFMQRHVYLSFGPVKHAVDG